MSTTSLGTVHNGYTGVDLSVDLSGPLRPNTEVSRGVHCPCYLIIVNFLLYYVYKVLSISCVDENPVSFLY